jgi:hypothetical protein
MVRFASPAAAASVICFVWVALFMLTQTTEGFGSTSPSGIGRVGSVRTINNPSSLNLFFSQNKKKTVEGEKKKKATATTKPASGKNGKGPAASATAETKKEGFVMLYGKPQYDWTTGKPVPSGKTMGRHNWLN